MTREPAVLVALDEVQLDERRLQGERALPADAVVIHPAERIDALPVAGWIEKVEIGVRAWRYEAAQLLAPAAADPGANSFRPQPIDGAEDELEVVHAVAAASSRGKRLDTICETPSVPIVTP